MDAAYGSNEPNPSRGTPLRCGFFCAFLSRKRGKIRRDRAFIMPMIHNLEGWLALFVAYCAFVLLTGKWFTTGSCYDLGQGMLWELVLSHVSGALCFGPSLANEFSKWSVNACQCYQSTISTAGIMCNLRCALGDELIHSCKFRRQMTRLCCCHLLVAFTLFCVSPNECCDP